MKLKIISTILLGSSLLFTACKKKEGDNTKNDPDKQESVAEYMSTKPGSYWYYQSNEGNIHYRTATGLMEVVNGRKYDLYLSYDTNSVMKEEVKNYYAKNENKYLTLIDLDGKQENYLEAIVYQDNSKIGDEWLNTGTVKLSGFNVDVEIYCKVVDNNATKVINGVTYDSVFVTKNTLKARQLPLVPTFVNVGTVDMWFKKGIGILGSNFDISILSLYSRQYNDELIYFHIEP